MHSLVSLLTALSVGLHLALGCCAHHTHQQCGNIEISAVKLAKTHQHAHGHSHGHSQASDATDVPACPGIPHDDCHETHCSCVLTGKTAIEFPVCITFLSSESSIASAQHNNASQVRFGIDSGGIFSLPVRLHLFKQVILI